MTTLKHGKRRHHAPGARAVLMPAVLIVFALAGCASPRNLLIETTPTAAEVEVISEHGVSRRGTSPLVVPVDFYYDAFYELRAAAPDSAAGESVYRLDRPGYQALTPVRQRRGMRRIMLRFDARTAVVDAGGARLSPAPGDSAPDDSAPGAPPPGDSAPDAPDAPDAQSPPLASDARPPPAASKPQKLLVDSKPPRAFLDVYDASGALVANGEAPVTLWVNFAESAHYDIRATPAGAKKAKGMLKIDARAYAGLPPGKAGARRAVIADAEFVLVDEMQEQIALSGEVVKTVLKRRAFKDTAESGGAVPALIHEFTPGRVLIGMSISPKGNRIAFAQSMPGAEYDGQNRRGGRNGGDAGASRPSSHLRVLRIGARGSLQYITTQNFADGYPAYSPDGEYLFFSSNRRRKNLSDILRISATGQRGISDVLVGHRNARAIRPTVANNGCVAMEFALFDADNRRIDEDHYIWTVGGLNRYPTQITKGYQPSISPDGKKIAYIGADGNLWMIGVSGAHRTQLSSGAAAVTRRYVRYLSEAERAAYQAAAEDVTTSPSPPYSQPSWSSDSKYILYAAMESNDPSGRPNEDIWMMNAQSGQKHQLTTNGSVDKYPLMAPDKKSVYFVSNRGGRWALWRIKVALAK